MKYKKWIILAIPFVVVTWVGYLWIKDAQDFLQGKYR